ncbi:MAG: hypothetical protein ACIARR_05120 [Phycisphaerales bacterium JB059]
MNTPDTAQHETERRSPDRPAPTPQPRAVVCPYCGVVSGGASRCSACGGRFDPLSRQATQNAMGPWYVRDEQNPTLPGCSYDTLVARVRQGKVSASSVVRGPTTRQFWMLAKRVPGVSHLLGFCHACQAKVEPEQYSCMSCGAVFEVDRDRQHLGVGPARLLPGQGSPERVAAFTQASHAAVERPTWSWESRAAASPSPTTTDTGTAPGADTDRIKLKRLEGVVARQRLTNRVLLGVCALLLLGIFIVSMLSRSTPASVAPSPDSTPVAAPEPASAIESDPPPVQAPEAGATEEPAEFDAEPGWDRVRDRVYRLISDGSSESLSAAVLELETLQRRDRLPGEGVELLERLRTEMDAVRLGDVP